MKAEALKNEDPDLLRAAESFDTLFSVDWYYHVSATASKSVGNAKAKKTKLLPFCRDIEKINIKLEEGMKSHGYPTLAKATLCAISLFNRKHESTHNKSLHICDSVRSSTLQRQPYT